jgi:hypothetical protein
MWVFVRPAAAAAGATSGWARNGDNNIAWRNDR